MEAGDSKAIASMGVAVLTTATPPSLAAGHRGRASGGLSHARCVVLIEASEESGSPDLPAYLEALRRAHRHAQPGAVPRLGLPRLPAAVGHHLATWSGRRHASRRSPDRRVCTPARRVASCRRRSESVASCSTGSRTASTAKQSSASFFWFCRSSLSVYYLRARSLVHLTAEAQRVRRRRLQFLQRADGEVDMITRSSFPALLFFVILAVGAALAGGLYGTVGLPGAAVVTVVTVLYRGNSGERREIASPWDRAVVLRLDQLPLAAWSGIVRHRTNRRHHPVLDRHARDLDDVQRREDADQRHGTRRRRRRSFLEGGRSAEGRARRRELRDRARLGRADGVARRHRQDGARRHARRSRPHQRRAPKSHRRAHRAMGRPGHLGRGARRAHPARAARRDVDAGAGGARAASARHPRRLGASGRGEVRGGGADVHEQPGSRCTFAA